MAQSKKTSIVADWPDAIRCGTGSVPGQIFMLFGGSSEGALYVQVYTSEIRSVRFSFGGIYEHRTGHDDSSRGCEGKSISQLYSEHRAFNFVTSTIQDSSGKTSMVPNWPDAIACDRDEGTRAIFMLHAVGNPSYYQQIFTGDHRILRFFANGDYHSSDGPAQTNSGCGGKSISQLYNEGRAFNFVTSKRQDSFGKTNIIIHWPDAVDCGYTVKAIFMIHGIDSRWAHYHQVSGDGRAVVFSPNGNYLSRTEHYSQTKGCEGKTIQQLYAEGRAFNFVTSKLCPSHEVGNGFSIGLLPNEDTILIAWSPGQNVDDSIGKGIAVSIYDYINEKKPVIEAVTIDDSNHKGTRPYVLSTNNETFVVAWDRAKNSMISEQEIYLREIHKQGQYVGDLLKVNTPNNVADCCVTLVSDGSGNIAAAWLREAADNKWHVYLKKIKGEIGTEVGIATGVDTDASNLSMINHKGALIVSWEEEGAIKVAKYDGSVGSPTVVTESSEVAKRGSLVTIGESILVGWDSSIGVDSEPQKIYGRILDGSGDPIDQRFEISSDINKKQCCLHFTKNNKGNVLATWISYDQEDSYIVMAQSFDNDGIKVGSAFVVSNEVRYFPVKSYQAEKVNIERSVISELGMKISILEDGAYCNSKIDSLNHFLYYGDAGKLVANIESFFIIKKEIEQVDNEELRIDEFRYTNKENTLKVINIDSILKEITQFSNQFRILFKESMGFRTEMLISMSAIEKVLQEIKPTAKFIYIENFDNFEWYKQSSVSMMTLFKELIQSYTHILPIPPKTCVNLGVSVKEERRVKLTVLANADMTEYRMSESGVKEYYDSEKVKADLEERTNGLDIVEHPSSNKVIAKIHAEITFTLPGILTNTTLVPYCFEPENQNSYVMLYENSEGFVAMDSALDSVGQIKIGNETEWCNIYSLRVGDFNGDGKSDLLCNLPDGTNKIMISDQGGFVSVFSNSSDQGVVLIAGQETWCSKKKGEYLYTGDFDGDGRTDLFCDNDAKSKLVLAGNSSEFIHEVQGIRFCYDAGRLLVGSFNPVRDSTIKSDLLCQSPIYGFRLALFNETQLDSGFVKYNSTVSIKFGDKERWCEGEESRIFVGDFNGDGKSDLLCNKDGFNYLMFFKQGAIEDMKLFTPAGSSKGRDSNGYVSIGEKGNWCKYNSYLGVGDFNGDGKDDLYCNEGGVNRLMLAKSSDSDVLKNYIAFESISLQSAIGEISIGDHNIWCEYQKVILGDFNGDHITDLLCNNFL